MIAAVTEEFRPGLPVSLEPVIREPFQLPVDRAVASEILVLPRLNHRTQASLGYCAQLVEVQLERTQSARIRATIPTSTVLMR